MFALLEKKGIYRVHFFEDAMGLVFVNYDLLPPPPKETPILSSDPNGFIEFLKRHYSPVKENIIKKMNLDIPVSEFDKVIKLGLIDGRRKHSVEIVHISFSTQYTDLHEKASQFPDLTKTLQETAKHYARLYIGALLPDTIISTSKKLSPEDKHFMATKMVLELIYSVYSQKTVKVYRPHTLQRTLQPLNLEKTKERNITALTLEQSYKELLEHHPDLYKELEKFLNEEHEIFVPALSSIYEQMVIDIIAQLINHPPVNVHPSTIKLIRLYLKPNTIPLDFHDHILVINRKDIMKIFKLSNDEFKEMFIGRKNRTPAILRLNGKPFSIRNQHGEITLSHILKVITFKSNKLHYYEIEPQWIFYQNGPRFVKDNFWKLRKIKEELNPKAHMPVINLRNKLITLNKPLEFTFSTLAGYAGLSSRKQRKQELMKKQILEYLDFLQDKLGDIQYEVINNNKVKIWRDI